MKDLHYTPYIVLCDTILYYTILYTGTGSVTLAGILSAAKIAQIPFTEMRFMCVGAGSAGLGVCDQVCILYYIVLYCTMIGMMNIVVHLLYMCIQVPCLFILYDVLCIPT